MLFNREAVYPFDLKFTIRSKRVITFIKKFHKVNKVNNKKQFINKTGEVYRAIGATNEY